MMLCRNSSIHCWMASVGYRMKSRQLIWYETTLPAFQIRTLNARRPEGASYYTLSLGFKPTLLYTWLCDAEARTLQIHFCIASSSLLNTTNRAGYMEVSRWVKNHFFLFVPSVLPVTVNHYPNNASLPQKCQFLTIKTIAFCLQFFYHLQNKPHSEMSMPPNVPFSKVGAITP